MKILFLTYRFFPDVGGIEVHSENLVKYFYESGAEVHLMTFSEVNSELPSFPFKIIRKPQVKELLKEYLWADIIYENNPTLKLSWPLLFIPKPHIITLHTWVSRSNGKKALQDFLKLYWLKRATQVIAVSNCLKMGTYESAIVIRNSYNDHLFNRKENIFKNRDFVFLGRLVSDKGVDMAITLIRDLNQKTETGNDQRSFSLTIIGEGPEKSHLQELTRKYRLEDVVDFKGQLSGEKLVESLNEHRYILIPSRWKEPFGLVALEGMAAGCIPIVSSGGGLPEAVGDAGLIFKRNDQNSLLQKVKELLENPAIEKKLKEKMSNHLQNHTISAVSAQYYNILQNTVKAYAYV